MVNAGAVTPDDTEFGGEHAHDLPFCACGVRPDPDLPAPSHQISSLLELPKLLANGLET